MKLNKILSILVLVVTLLTVASTVIMAVNPSEYTGNTEGTDSIKTIGQQIIGIVQVVGSIASVAILVVLGIKYMMGSTEEKAEYKKTLIPYIIGAVLIFAASNIAGIVFSWANSISSETK